MTTLQVAWSSGDIENYQYSRRWHVAVLVIKGLAFTTGCRIKVRRVK